MTVDAIDLRNLCAGYGKVEVLRDITMKIGGTEIVALLGPNGAGKTSLIRCLLGMLDIRDGAVTVLGEPVRGQSSAKIVRRGVAVVPEGRGTFTDLSVVDNLRLGALVHRGRNAEIDGDIERWLSLFPSLAGRGRQAAGTLSGGEQQMLAIARALMARPRLLLLDEPSLGLAPLIVDEMFRRLAEVAADSDLAVLVVEQQLGHALDLASRAYVIEAGVIVFEGTAEEIRSREDLVAAYLGA